MRYYGKIKWFGGYNNKTGNYNNYGFIANIRDEKSNYKDVYFHKDEVRFNSKKLKKAC